MAVSSLSIRRQLLLLGVLATASIWTGALLQQYQLRKQTLELNAVREGVASAQRYAEASRVAAQERGLTNGWLLDQRRIDNAELASVRTKVDTQLTALAAEDDALPVGVRSRREELSRLRVRVDRRDVEPGAVFAFYNSLIAAMQDAAAQHLARSMIFVGLPYEHLNHLERIVERVAQMRGRANGALRLGTLTPSTEQALARELVLFDEASQLYDRSVPHAAGRRIAPALDSTAVRTTVARVRLLLEVHRLDALAPDATTWWSLATEAVDTLAHAASSESLAISQQASERIDNIEQQMGWTVATLFALGVVTLVMVLSTVSRIVFGLNRLLAGLDDVSDRRNFAVRIEDGRQDEFGQISGGINRLIAIAGGAVDGNQVLGKSTG